ncbi:hypothetical protein PR202_gb16281 [Eleusine coracana subsp. coracana]|uniref:Uncharacterized protein n=1 Tax=Eleusine coracana subsp. coracana TaxID=191504 RepID=A0AAV5EXP5_ELECO|nr:hypothetical protein PR202_gb16281 [Eleusine coracana subsp. coracana]
MPSSTTGGSRTRCPRSAGGRPASCRRPRCAVLDPQLGDPLTVVDHGRSAPSPPKEFCAVIADAGEIRVAIVDPQCKRGEIRLLHLHGVLGT